MVVSTAYNALTHQTTSNPSCQRLLPQTDVSPGHAQPRFRHALVVSCRPSLVPVSSFISFSSSRPRAQSSDSDSTQAQALRNGRPLATRWSHAIVEQKEACPLDCRGCTWAAHAKVCADDLYLTSAPLYYVSNARSLPVMSISSV